MIEKWDYDKLGNVCDTSAGGTPLKSHKEYYEGGTVPWIRSGEVNNRNICESEIKITEVGLNNSSAKLFPSDTVVVAMYGATAGQVGILNIECATNQAVCGILPNDKFIPEFLYYFFLKFKAQLISQAVGNAQPNISQTKIRNVTIPIPPLEEQQQIVAILDKAFEAIDQAQANIEKNIENAKELFQSKLNDIFSQKGEGWEEKSIEEVSEVINGYSFKGTDFSAENGVKAIKITNVGINEFVEDISNNLPKVFLEKYSKVKVQEGNIVLALTRTIISSGLKVARVPNSYNRPLAKVIV